ncbi:hypothetical protein [Pseudonocardia endophytica]|uniref:Uncharacterized protein n=1 Tax=Pseudonocardia endophytica TaxID=401976 RepID=A0A4R1HWU5_PSEEN|nr:hypothetical protein [Pseudonocardia endophytica]TCK25963.1 hypothetical protein EV378_1790 [Pseudonocardia endophytica]
MKIDWAALGLVSVVSLAIGVVVVVLFALGTVGLAARRTTVGGRHDGQGPTLGRTTGSAIAGVCFAACAAILLYGLYLIAA